MATYRGKELNEHDPIVLEHILLERLGSRSGASRKSGSTHSKCHKGYKYNLGHGGWCVSAPQDRWMRVCVCGTERGGWATSRQLCALGTSFDDPMTKLHSRVPDKAQSFCLLLCPGLLDCTGT